MTFSLGSLPHVYSLKILPAPLKLFNLSFIDNGALGFNRVEPRIRTNNIKIQVYATKSHLYDADMNTVYMFKKGEQNKSQAKNIKNI